jgi:hypothetical protein
MTLMSSSWPKLWATCAMSSAGWLLMAWVRAKAEELAVFVACFDDTIGHEGKLLGRGLSINPPLIK